MKPHLICGVDPGLSGAIAFLNPGTREVVELVDMPVALIGKNQKRQVDHGKLSFLVNNYARETKFAVIEDVHSMPKDGPVQAHAFGRAVGMVIGVVAGAGIPIRFTKPAVWKAIMGLSYDKKLSIALVKKLFCDQPATLAHFKLAKHDGRAEALLLAVFGAKAFRE